MVNRAHIMPMVHRSLAIPLETDTAIEALAAVLRSTKAEVTRNLLAAGLMYTVHDARITNSVIAEAVKIDETYTRISAAWLVGDVR